MDSSDDEIMKVFDKQKMELEASSSGHKKEKKKTKTALKDFTENEPKKRKLSKENSHNQVNPEKEKKKRGPKKHKHMLTDMETELDKMEEDKEKTICKQEKIKNAQKNLKNALDSQHEFDHFVEKTIQEEAFDPSDETDIPAPSFILNPLFEKSKLQKNNKKTKKSKSTTTEEEAEKTEHATEKKDNMLNELEKKGLTIGPNGKVRKINVNTRNRGKMEEVYDEMRREDTSSHFGYKDHANNARNEAIYEYDKKDFDSMNPYNRQGVNIKITPSHIPRPDTSEEALRYEAEREETLLNDTLGNNDPKSVRDTVINPLMKESEWWCSLDSEFEDLWSNSVNSEEFVKDIWSSMFTPITDTTNKIPLFVELDRKTIQENLVEGDGPEHNKCVNFPRRCVFAIRTQATNHEAMKRFANARPGTMKMIPGKSFNFPVYNPDHDIIKNSNNQPIPRRRSCIMCTIEMVHQIKQRFHREKKKFSANINPWGVRVDMKGEFCSESCYSSENGQGIHGNFPLYDLNDYEPLVDEKGRAYFQLKMPVFW